MKNLIRFSLVILGAVIVGSMLMCLVEMRHTNLVVADQPMLPSPVAAQWKPWQQPSPPVAIDETQILLQTIVLDIDLEKMSEAGIDFGSSQASPARNPTKQRPGQFSIVSQREAHLFAKLLVANGAAKILAEPTIVTHDGRSAKFLSGGEVPLIVPQARNTVAVEYRRFGTSVDFLPRRLANGKLRLEIRIDQTDLDHSKSIEVNGVKISGFKTRLVDTALELQAGEAAMLRNKRLLVIVTHEFVAPLAKTDISPQPPQRVHEIPVKAGMDVSMLLGQSVILRFEKKIPELRVGDDSIIHAQPTSPNRVRVTAKRAGWTILTSRDEAGELQEIPIDVVAPRLPAPPASAVKRPASPATVSVTALVYTFDPKKVQDDGLDVYSTLSESTAPAEIIGSTPQPESPKAIVSVLSPRTVVTLTRQLSQTKGAEVLSRPQVLAISGQAGRIEIGSRVQLPSSGDVQQASGRFQDVGIVLDIVPIVRGGRVHLEAWVKHS